MIDWMKKASTAVYLALCAVFRLSPESDQAAFRFRDTFLQETTYPQAKRTDDVTYYTIRETSDPSAAYAQLRYTEGKAEIEKTIPLSVVFTFYGPRADEDAELLWSHLFLDLGKDSPRSILRQNKIVPIRDMNRPVSLPELDGAVWRRRSDLTLRMNMLHISAVPFAPIEHSPETTVRHD